MLVHLNDFVTVTTAVETLPLQQIITSITNGTNSIVMDMLVLCLLHAILFFQLNKQSRVFTAYQF